MFFCCKQAKPLERFFEWMHGDLTSLRRLAELGFSCAQAWMAGQTRGEEKFKFSQVAAGQGERDGFYWLVRCFRDGEGCEKGLNRAKGQISAC